MVWQTYQQVNIPIIGMGGILTATDALEFLMAGAAAVAIGTGLYVDPFTPQKVLAGIMDYMTAEGFSSVAEITGIAQK